MKIPTKPKTFSAIDMYLYYINRLLNDNPNYIVRKLSIDGKTTRFSEVYKSADKELNYIISCIKTKKEEYSNLLEVEQTISIKGELSDIEIAIKAFEIRKKEIINSEAKSIQKIIDYKTFKNVLTSYNKKAAERIINGEKLDLLHGLGYILAKRVERNFNNKAINWQATNKLREANGGKLPTKDDKNIYAYYTDEDWIKVWWKKVKGIKNISVYTFVSSGGQVGKGFRQVFSKANMENKMLRLLYDFYPYIPIKKKNVI